MLLFLKPRVLPAFIFLRCAIILNLLRKDACRLCVVEATGARTLVASCVYPVAEGMVVKTNTDKVRAARRMVVELLLANHPKDCHCVPKKAVTVNCRI